MCIYLHSQYMSHQPEGRQKLMQKAKSGNSRTDPSDSSMWTSTGPAKAGEKFLLPLCPPQSLQTHASRYKETKPQS